MTTATTTNTAAQALLTGTVHADDFGDGYTLILDPELAEAAQACARGRYQADLLRGVEAWSGATLRTRWGSRYADSRRSLLARMTAAQIPHCEVRLPRGGRRCIVIGLDRAEVAR